MLDELIERISGINGIEWIRLLYSYPDSINDGLIRQIAQNPKAVKYLDIPIQHASSRILKLMNRRSDREKLEALIERIRTSIQDVVIRTTVITGFPGETDEDFYELLSFIQRIRFDRLGVFKYSKEEGTPAAALPDKVMKSVVNKRYKELMQMQKEISFIKNAQRVNKVYRTIVDGVSEDGIFYYGRTYAECPDVDGKIYFTARKQLITGEFVDVKILQAQEYDLTGDVADESTE